MESALDSIGRSYHGGRASSDHVIATPTACPSVTLSPDLLPFVTLSAREWVKGLRRSPEPPQ